MMKKYFPSLFIFLFFILIFKEWFGLNLISAGDFSSFSFSNLKNLQFFPYAWGINLAVGGLGAFVSPFSWLHFIITTPLIFAKLFSLNWAVTERFFYLYPLLAALLIVPGFVFKKLFPEIKFSFFATLIFSLNTYILMLIGGGQIFIALSYALSPLVFYLFVNSFTQKKLFSSLFTGLFFSLEAMLDLRIAYVVAFAFLFYLLFNVSLSKKFITGALYALVIPICLTFFIHSYWLIPTLILHKNPLYELGQIYTSSSAVKFFSFARLENTISLLHPNWPENLFGKVYFMKPEFLFIPMLAYISLFFVNKESRKLRKNIVFFALLGLIGAFLAKGANDPLGIIYVWLFDHIPGFIMFRDPTKWYVLVALSYSILIPYSIYKIFDWLRSRNQFLIFNFQNLFLILTTLYLLFLIRPALLGELNGTFKSSSIPKDYLKLEQFISNDSSFYRTMWIPTVQRYGFYSNNHPAFVSKDFLNTMPLDSNKTLDLLQKSSVRYIIVPYDSQGEIFLKDRIYNEALYLKEVNDVKKIKWLKETKDFGKIVVLELPNPKDHFWTDSNSLTIKYQYVSPVEYLLEVKNATAGSRIIFSENYNSSWVAMVGDTTIKSEKYNVFNSFRLEKDGNYNIKVYYSPQAYVNIGLVVSVVSLIVIIFLLIFGYRYKK